MRTGPRARSLAIGYRSTAEIAEVAEELSAIGYRLSLSWQMAGRSSAAPLPPLPLHLPLPTQRRLSAIGYRLSAIDYRSPGRWLGAA
ncbi:hypothetical protein, partial [Chloroflexus sp.]